LSCRISNAIIVIDNIFQLHMGLQAKDLSCFGAIPHKGDGFTGSEVRGLSGDYRPYHRAAADRQGCAYYFQKRAMDLKSLRAARRHAPHSPWIIGVQRDKKHPDRLCLLLAA